MHWEKYMILLPPFVLIAVLLVVYLPFGQKYYAILTGLVFQSAYKGWIFIENKRKENEVVKSS